MIMYVNSNTPEVSIILPTYNRADTIKRSVTSIINQTFENWELLIVDDGSTDSTAESVNNLDPRIKYHYQKNKGVYTARNNGLNLSRCNYITFMDSDDEWMPQKLTLQVEKFEKTSGKVGLIYAFYDVIYDKTNTLVGKIDTHHKGDVYEVCLSGNPIGASTVLIRKEVLQKVGYFDERFNGMQDWDLWLRISKHYHFDYVPKYVFKYYLHDNQLSCNLALRVQIWECFLAKFKDDFIQLKLSLTANKNVNFSFF